MKKKSIVSVLIILSLIFGMSVAFPGGQVAAASVKLDPPKLSAGSPHKGDVEAERAYIFADSGRTKVTGFEFYYKGKLVANEKSSWNNLGSIYLVYLTPSTKYTYKVRSYKTYNEKQYYNSKTKRWQKKKPAAKEWKGKKTRKVKKTAYSKFATISFTTAKAYNWRTDIDNIRSEVLASLTAIRKEYMEREGISAEGLTNWNDDPISADFIVDERLNTIAQQCAQHKWEMSGSSIDATYQANNVKTFTPKKIMRIDGEAGYPTWADPYQEENYVGVGYYKGKLIIFIDNKEWLDTDLERAKEAGIQF